MLTFCLLLASPALAAQTKSSLTMLINERGSVEVVDRWAGLAQEAGVYSYFSATKEVGVVPVNVRNYGFTLSFATRSYLRYEDGIYHFVTPDFYYAEGPLDVDLTLTFPLNLVFLDANVEPEYIGEGVVHWSLPESSHSLVMARFERVGPFVAPGHTGPDFQVDPATLERLSADELPASADDVLKELENIITVARASQSTDPDFLRVMDKLLAKFYYVLSSNGLLLDYRLPGDDSGGEDEPEPLAPAKDGGGSGIIESGSDAVKR